MNKTKERIIETQLAIHMNEFKAINDRETGKPIPYLLSKNGEVYRYPCIEIKPFIDGETGYMAVNLWYDGDFHKYSLLEMMALAFVEKPDKNHNVIVLKSGDPSNQHAYRADNIEWVENTSADGVVSNAKVDRCPYGFIKDNPMAMAKLCWCRARQNYDTVSIGDFFNMKVEEVIAAIGSVDDYMRTVFRGSQISRANDPDRADRSRQLREINDFIVYLLNIEPILGTTAICHEINKIVPGVKWSSLRKRIQKERRDNPNVFSDHRQNPEMLGIKK